MTRSLLKEISVPEKEMLSMIIPESPKLAYPTKWIRMPKGYKREECYIIPDEDKEAILKELYPFVCCPKMDDIRFDIHEQNFFKVYGFIVIRSRGRNFLASPYFSKSGGLVVDWMTPNDPEFAAEVVK